MQKKSELVKALRFCVERLESWEEVMADFDGVVDFDGDGKLRKWDTFDERDDYKSAVEVGNSVLGGGTFEGF